MFPNNPYKIQSLKCSVTTMWKFWIDENINGYSMPWNDGWNAGMRVFFYSAWRYWPRNEILNLKRPYIFMWMLVWLKFNHNRNRILFLFALEKICLCKFVHIFWPPTPFCLTTKSKQKRNANDYFCLNWMWCFSIQLCNFSIFIKLWYFFDREPIQHHL